MDITIRFTQDEVEDISSQSAAFRWVLFRTLADAQNELAKKSELSEEQLMERLRTYIRNTFSPETKLGCIKYVREWLNENRYRLSTATYNKLYSLNGTKTFVEDLIDPPENILG